MLLEQVFETRAFRAGIALLQRFSFHLHINLDVSMGCCDVNVTQPAANHGQLYPRLKEVHVLRFSPNDVARFSSLGATNLIQK